MTEVAAPKKIYIITAFAALYLIWGSTYLGILFAIRSIPPFLMAGTRFFLAGMIMYTAARLQGAARPEPVTWRSSAIVGACLLLCGNGAVTISEKWVPTGLAALLVATVPIYIAFLGWLTGSSPRPTPLVWVGLIGGFIGVAALVGPTFTTPASLHQNHLRLGMAILLIGSLIWSAGSLYSRTVTNAPSPFLAAGQQMLCGGALLFLFGLALAEYRSFDLHQITLLSLGAFIYLVVIGALVGFPAYIYLLRHCDPAKVATYAYVNPVVAVFLGTVFAGETLTLRTSFGAMLIIGSVALVIRAEQLRPKGAPPVAAAIEPADCVR
jgi:drug/metabolite transporter (DMT)-like permease